MANCFQSLVRSLTYTRYVQEEKIDHCTVTLYARLVTLYNNMYSLVRFAL